MCWGYIFVTADGIQGERVALSPGDFIYPPGGREGERVVLLVEASDSIEHLKARIQNIFGMASHQQGHTFTFWPQVRRPQKRVFTLSENAIEIGHIVDEELKPWFRIDCHVWRVSGGDVAIAPRRRLLGKQAAALV